MPRRSSMPLVLILILSLTSCRLLDGGPDDVHESGVDAVDLDLAAPTYAVAAGKGLLLRSGDAELLVPRASEVEWLPRGRALVYSDAPGYTSRARIWDPSTNKLGSPVTLWQGGEALVTPEPGSLKRSVTQVNVSHERLVKEEGRAPVVGEALTAYDVDLKRKWRVDLPGPDSTDDVSVERLTRGYSQGHTIDGITYLSWSDFDADGDETEPHYGLLRGDPAGEVIDQVQVNERVVSTWLSADGASLLALRRVSGHPCGGCQVELELVELDPATGVVVAEYGMPEEYDATWNVAEVDKVGDRVAVRFTEYTEKVVGEKEVGRDRLRGTWVREGSDWSLLAGSEDEVTWWQGPDDKIVARAAGRAYTLFWVRGEEERPLRGRFTSPRIGSVPGHALPPE
jgi:hypothetical protein